MRYLCVFFSLFIISCGNLPRKNLNVKLLNTNSDSFKILEIENKTKNNIIFPYDTTYYGYNSLLDDKENNLFFPKIIFFDKNDKEIEGLVTTSDHSYFDEEYLVKGSHLMRKEYLEKQTFTNSKMIKIKKNEKIHLKIPIKRIIFLKNPYDILDFKIDKKTYIQIKYNISKNLVRKIFSKTTLDSLKQTNYRFYDGEIVSNKLPLFLKE